MNETTDTKEEEVPQFLIYKESSITIHCFDALLNDIYEFIFDSENSNAKHWTARKEIRIGFVLEDVDNTKLQKTQQLLLYLSAYNVVALTLEMHSSSPTLSSSSAEFIQLFDIILDLIETKSLERFKFCFNGLQPIHYNLLTQNCIRYLSSFALNQHQKKVTLRLNINKSLFNYWHKNTLHFSSFQDHIKATQCTDALFFTFKHLSLSTVYLQQAMSLFKAIQCNASISSLSFKFHDNQIFEEMFSETTAIDTTLQIRLIEDLVSCLRHKSLRDTTNTFSIPVWKEFERNVDCTSNKYSARDLALRLDFENCCVVFPTAIVYKCLDAVRGNVNVSLNVLILLCNQWTDKNIWCSLQQLVCSVHHCVERLEIWGPFHSEEMIVETAQFDSPNAVDDEDEFICDFFDAISWREVSLQSFKMDRIRFASNECFVDKFADLIKYGPIMMNFVSVAFEMLSKQHAKVIIDAFVYRLRTMFDSQRAVQDTLQNLSYCHLTHDVIQTIHCFCKHNHIRLEVFVDFLCIEDEWNDDGNDDMEEFEVGVTQVDDKIREKLKIEAESSKLGRMQRQTYFKKCLSRLFDTADGNETNFDSVFQKLANTISVGPVILD